MFKNASLQTKLTASFLLLGVVVFAVASIGRDGNTRLSRHLNTLSRNSLPSISGLGKINEGQTQIQSSERALLNTRLDADSKQIEVKRIQQAWVQINEGFKEYESAPRSPQEDKLYRQFLQNWKVWEQDHERFMRLYQEFQRLKIPNPLVIQVELLKQGKKSTPDLAKAQAASERLYQLSELSADRQRISFNAATEDIEALLAMNAQYAIAAQQSADRDIILTNRWMAIGLVAGPLGAVLFGIYFSRTIAKPLGAKIAGIINAVVSSSTEIAVTVEQQERTAAQQAASVHQTTTTMDELAVSSRVMAEQAESVAAGARQVLAMSQTGNQAVGRTLEGMADLKEKVGAIAEQIVRLNSQADQIGNITNLVSDLANQTNMLALNATVEAVRAGEQGKGFGVVATEIRKLADRSKQSAAKINSLVADIQNAVNSTAMVTDDGTQTVDGSVKIAQGTADAFQGVADAINTIVLNTQQISLTATQQATAIRQVVDAMNVINQGAVQTASGLTQTKVGTQKLNDAATQLKAVV